MVGCKGEIMLLDIKKVGENFYLVNGEYTASSFNEAVVIAYEKKEKIKGFEVDYMGNSFWKNLKNKLNFPFIVLESWM
jgi:hypothetical protein